MTTIQEFERKQAKNDIPEFRSGDTVQVYTKIKEGEKERIQVFEGVVIKKKGNSSRSTFTVRKVSYGVGVERVFPVCSPMIDRVEVKQKGQVRRSKLYYLRELSGRAARIAEKKEWQLAREQALSEEFGGEVQQDNAKSEKKDKAAGK